MPDPLSKGSEHVLDLHDRGLFSAKEIAAAFRAYARIPPDAVLLNRAQRDALRGEIGEHSEANTIWGVEMLVVPEGEVARESTYVKPGSTVVFHCGNCAELYRQTVQPRRDTARALWRIDEGDIERARDLIQDAHEDLTRIADYLNEAEA